MLPESWSTDEGVDYGVVHVYSTDTFKEEWKSEVYEGSISATAMQIVNESRTELVIHTWSYDTVNGSSIAQLFVLDTDSHSVLWESPIGASVDIVPADLYGSSRNEIVAAVSRGDYPEVKGFFYAYNDTTLLETWSSGELQGSPAILCAGDIDGDGRGELAGSTIRDDPTGRRSKTVLTVWEFYEGPSLLPDLAILPKDIYLSDPNPVEGFPLNISAVATNIGNKASGAFCATFLVDGIQQAQTTLELPAGCSTTAVFTWAPRAGNHTLEVRLDPRNLVRELNENNNNASIRVSVRERPRPIAVITSPREGEEYVEGQNITFDGRSSLAPQGCEFVWSSDLSGPIGTGPLLNASLPMGDHTISLELLDPATGLLSCARVNIIVLPPPPPSGEARAVISSPREGARFTAGDPIFFDGSRSQASERGLKLEFLWVSNISGELARIPKFTRALPPGDHMITLKVEDEHNRTQSASVNISVSPVDGVVAIIDSPLDGQVFEANQEIRFSASSSSGPPGCYLSYLWSSSISGPLSTEREFSRRLPFGNHTISLRVTDDKERSATAYVNITVKRLIDYPPVVAFVHPSEGAIVQGVVIINGTAWDDTEVVGVYVRIDHQPWDIASRTTSWSYR
ncbi:MAG: CARDB domain-containing protein [Thermoplasmata archaeon]